MGCGLDRLDEPVLMAVPKPMQTEFEIHHKLESCDILPQVMSTSQTKCHQLYHTVFSSDFNARSDSCIAYAMYVECGYLADDLDLKYSIYAGHTFSAAPLESCNENVWTNHMV